MNKKLLYGVKKLLFKIALICFIAYAIGTILVLVCAQSLVQENYYVSKVIIKANNGKAFSLQEIVNFEWDEAILMSGEYNDGIDARERYNSNYKIKLPLNDTTSMLAFFKNGLSVHSMRFDRYSDFVFKEVNSVITPDMKFIPIKDDGGTGFELVLDDSDG